MNSTKSYSNKKEANVIWEEIKRIVDTLPVPSVSELINAKVTLGGVDDQKHQLSHYTLSLNDYGVRFSSSPVNTMDIVYSYDRCDKCKRTSGQHVTAYCSLPLGRGLDLKTSGISYTRSIEQK